MHIILVNPRGFCAGVNRAVQTLEEVVTRFFDKKIFVYHEIVHNTYVVNRFMALGVQFIFSLNAVPEYSVVMFSAHGVSPQIREEAVKKSLKVIDATCPLVSRVHQAVKSYVEKGYHVIYIGHAGHDEAVGTVGEAPQQITVISSEQEARNLTHQRTQNNLPYKDLRLACLMQTTLSITQTEQIVNILREQFPNIEISDKNTCYATRNRQEAVQILAKQADTALVIGSVNSSNSRRLCEIAEQQGIVSRLIDGADEINPQWFSGKETVLITAGASAPEHVVQSCLARLHAFFDVSFEEVVVREENVVFSLPSEIIQYCE
ncbi:MAG: 4-hydroxy-3-methylbut-2-enyl diphosphate reductase [Planctomycetaceae bacterium]|jgi:4-hydroxy-3-methylbut-2-enyl diphosphate reductase|nr:4-hydroxy-3-methylbut-2-enyl diphosphate reductase [Planctomycetaceae bacterium]